MLTNSLAQPPDEKSSHVPDIEEKAILDRQLYGIQGGAVNGKLGPWTYATRWDIIVVVLSSIAGVAAGAANPLLVVSRPQCCPRA
jgi:hypothetical protein